jgi:hypothetical protein
MARRRKQGRAGDVKVLASLIMLVITAVVGIICACVSGLSKIYRETKDAHRAQEQVCIDRWFEHRRRRRKRQELSYAAVRKASRRRSLARTPCQQCGKENSEAEPSQAHHPDMEYNLCNALAIIWLCRTCHESWHKQHYDRRRAAGVTRGEPWWMRDENDQVIVPSPIPLSRLSSRALTWWTDWEDACRDETPYGERSDIREPREDDRPWRRGTCEGCGRDRRQLKRIESGQYVCIICRSELHGR